MRAAVLTESHGFEVVDLPDPAPEAGELLLRVEACGICGSDLKAHVRMPVGAVLGHEFCGEVVGIGAGVDTSWREGQLVAAMPLMVCGRCRWCQDGDVAHCERLVMLGLGGPGGGFAEYVRVDPTTSVRLPSDVGGFGALVEPLAVGLHSVAAARIRHGDRIAVIGGGNVGAAVAYWARRVGAGEVVVSDPDARRRSGADRFGATDVHDPSAAPLPQDFDVVFECVGIPGMLQAAIDAATLHGRVVVAGVCTAPDPVVPIPAVMKELEMRFTVFYRLREFAAAAAVLADGAFPADAFVTTRIGLDGVGDAFTRLVAHASDERKVLVVPGL